MTKIVVDKKHFNLCQYNFAWRGICRKQTDGGPYCEDHAELKCEKCGGQITGQCEEDAGSFVCGYPVCKKGCHKHK